MQVMLLEWIRRLYTGQLAFCYFSYPQKNITDDSGSKCTFTNRMWKTISERYPHSVFTGLVAFGYAFANEQK